MQADSQKAVSRAIAVEQSMTQAIMQAAIETANAGIRTKRKTDNPVNNARPVQTVQGSGGPVPKPPTFDWQEKDRRLNEQFINDINHYMMTEIIMELTAIKKTNEISSEQVLAWARRVAVKKA